MAGAANSMDCSVGHLKNWASKQPCSVASKVYVCIVKYRGTKRVLNFRVGNAYDHIVVQVDLGEEGVYIAEIGFGLTTVRVSLRTQKMTGMKNCPILGKLQSVESAG